MLSGYEWDFSWIGSESWLLATAALLSLKILVISAFASVFFGLLIGEGLLSNRWYVNAPLRVFVDLFRLTPPMLQIVLVFFFVPMVFGVRLPALEAGIIALSLNYAAFLSEIFRAGVVSLGKGQREAGEAMGMTPLTVLWRVIYPQALRRMLPPLTNMAVNLTKDTSLLSVIGVAEMFNISQSIAARSFKNVEVLLVVAGLYLVINIPLAVISNRLYARQSVKI